MLPVSHKARASVLRDVRLLSQAHIWMKVGVEAEDSGAGFCPN